MSEMNNPTLTERDYDRVLRAGESPPTPNPAALEAARRHLREAARNALVVDREVQALLDENARLREALKPFAYYAFRVGDGWPDDTRCCLLFLQPDGRLIQDPTVNLGHCYRAREALGEKL